MTQVRTSSRQDHAFIRRHSTALERLPSSQGSMPTEDSREALALIIPPESKYALLSVSLPVDQELPARLNLGKGISATRGIGFDIPDHWKDWIGSLATDEIRGSALCLWTIAPSERPSILDEENR